MTYKKIRIIHKKVIFLNYIFPRINSFNKLIMIILNTTKLVDIYVKIDDFMLEFSPFYWLAKASVLKVIILIANP
jgi:hypothetical protein